MRLRAAAMAGVVLLLSLGLSFGAAPAHAWTVGKTPVAVAVGSTLRSPAARVLAVGVGTGPIGLGLTAGILGVTAYQTRDTWVPILKGWINQASSSEGSGAKGWWRISRHPDNVNVVRIVQAQTAATSMRYDFSFTCEGGATATASDVRSTPGYWSGGQETFDFGLCGAGVKVVQATVSGTMTDYGVPPASFADGYDASKVEQTTTVQCKNTDTGAITTITDTMVGYDDRVFIPSCADRVPGTIPWSGQIKAGPQGGTKKDVQTWTTNQDAFNDYGDCFNGTAGLVCKIKVWIDGQACSIGEGLCPYWHRLYLDEPERVTCRFGSHVVAMSNCDPLRKGYRADLDPITWDSTKPDGSVDTKTETPTSTEPGTGTIPETGTNPGTSPGPAITETTDPETSNCWGEGWSWNPVSWVYVPVKCAMLWAFVPKNAPSFSDVPSPLPAGWLPSLPNLGASSCGPVSMPSLDLGYRDWTVGSTQLFDTCAAPWPLVRTFTYNGLLALLLVTVVWKAFRAVTSGVGMGVSTGGGSDET